MADEQERGEGLAVHLVGAEQAQLIEHGLAEQVGFVDDDERRAAFGSEQVAKGGANAGDHARAAEGWLLTEGQQQIAVETADAQQRVGQIDHQVAVEIERGRKGTHGGGLAGADLAGCPRRTPAEGEADRRRARARGRSDARRVPAGRR